MKFLVTFGFVVFLSSLGLSQEVNAKKVKKLHISPELRARFVERLKLFIEYERSQEYDKQFDLLATQCPKYRICERIERDNYSKQKTAQMKGYGKLLELKFTGVAGRKLKDNCLGIYLTPKLVNKNKVYYNASTSFACLQGDDWYFRFDLLEI